LNAGVNPLKPLIGLDGVKFQADILEPSENRLPRDWNRVKDMVDRASGRVVEQVCALMISDCQD
jgi:hypothetical protein